jgi:MEMO1 family protein
MKYTLLILIAMALVSPAAQNVRPVKDDVGFCWNQDGMKRLISYLEEYDTTKVPDQPVVAGISAHDDFLYAGEVYYPLYKHIQAKEVVIFGVTHKTVRDQIGDPQNVLILDEYTEWKGMSGNVPICGLRDYIKKKLKSSEFIVSNKAHEQEHSIEAQIPFLQYFNTDFCITPIMVTGMPFDKMDEISSHLAPIIVSYMREKKLTPGKDIVFLISADANHYGPDFNNAPYGLDKEAHQKGLDQDARLIQTYLTGTMNSIKIKGLTGELWGATYKDYKSSYWCGKYSIPFGMLATMKVLQTLEGKQLEGTLLRFDDTYSTGVLPVNGIGCGITAPFSLKHWVSFFSVSYHTAQ